MKLPATLDIANDNGKQEDHLVVAVVAIHAAVKGLAAPVELLEAPPKGEPPRWPTR
jgi:hypothetical protein